MSELLTLPHGDPEQGFILAAKAGQLGQGTLPQSEQDWRDFHQGEYDADVTRVTEAEHQVVLDRQAADEALAGALRVSSIYPAWAKIGDPSFLLHVYGSGFTMSTKILFAGNPEPITFVSENEITTGINMPLWVGPDFIEVSATETAVGNEGDAVGVCLFQFMT